MIPQDDLVYMNVGLDMQDLLSALSYQTNGNASYHGGSINAAGKFTRCSAMVKVVGDDLYSSHVMGDLHNVTYG